MFIITGTHTSNFFIKPCVCLVSHIYRSQYLPSMKKRLNSDCGKFIFSRYFVVPRQLRSQPCGLRLSHSKDPTGLRSDLEAFPRQNKLLPWERASSQSENEQPSQSHGDVQVGREDHALTKDRSAILTFLGQRRWRFKGMREPCCESCSLLRLCC